MKVKGLLTFAILLLFCLTGNSFAAAKRSPAKSRKARSQPARLVKVKMHTRVRYHARRAFLPASGILFETLNGEKIIEQGAKQFFNPASVMKVATSYTALHKLGYDFRFSTNFYITGPVDATGTLQGNLILAATGDPGFYSENIFLVRDKLRELGINRVAGDLVVTGPFYLNFDPSSHRSAHELVEILAARGWSNSDRQAWQRYSQGRANLEYQPLAIEGGARIEDHSTLTGAKPIFTHYSRPLADLLKSQNDFSNNFMAEIVGRYIGGPRAIESFLINEVGIPADEITVTSASGLGANRITPEAALKLLRSFYQSVTTHGKRLEDLLPVAGVDEGTLEDRFTDPDVRGSVVAKTGTLPSRGASALVGIAYSRERGVIFFAILNRDYVPRARHQQDELVVDILNQCGGPNPPPLGDHNNENSTAMIVTAK